MKIILNSTLLLRLCLPPPRRSIYIIMCMRPVGGVGGDILINISKVLKGGMRISFVNVPPSTGEHIENHNVYPPGVGPYTL